jgi:ABC-2 type transport system permease protein
MSTTNFELKLLLRSRLALGALIFLLLVTLLALWSGHRSVQAQNAALTRIAAAHQEDVARVAAKYKNGGGAGDAAYYTNHLTWDTPAPLAFASFGQRDLQPFVLRIRLLGLHSQLYESETVNPELALPGRFDFAFVLIYLVPLIVIALMHDLVTSERESGRLRLIGSLPVSQTGFWLKRTALRYLLVFAAVAIPFCAVALLSNANAFEILGATGIAGIYIAFWFGLSLLIAVIAQSSASSAAASLTCFVVLTLVLPTAFNAFITRAVPAAKGVELTLAQRQEVHQGWDLPKPVTFEKFFKTHPEWSDTPPVNVRFHWKWYYAMHQAGDDAVAPLVADYRRSLAKRENMTRWAGLMLPSVGTQVLLHRLANTDLQGQLDYQDQIARFHKELRHYYYPFVFHERKFGPAEFEKLPKFQSPRPAGEVKLKILAMSGLLTLILFAIAVRWFRRIAT